MESSSKDEEKKQAGSENISHNTNFVRETTKVSKSKSSRCSFSHDIDLNDLIGQFGLYHLNVMLFNLIREATTSMDAFALSLSLPKDVIFQCTSSSSSFGSNNHTKSQLLTDDLDIRCYYVNVNDAIEPCQKWLYPDSNQQELLSVKWNLVCHREWLGPMILTSYFIGRFVGNFFWGYFADKFGRWNSHTTCHLLGLLFSIACVFPPSVGWLIFFRFGSAFCAQGYYVLNTLQVEMIGKKYRTFTTMTIHIGWGLGVAMLAFIGLSTNNWQHLLAICPLIMLLGLPWLFTMPESIRWLMLHGRWDAARQEIKRGAKYNFVTHHGENLDSRIDEFFRTRLFENQPESASLIDLFKHRILCFNLVSLWLSFLVTSFIYYSRTLDFAPDETSIIANFLISGAGEWLCLLVTGLCMYLFKRKTCLAAFICLSGISFLIEGILSHNGDTRIDISEYLLHLDKPTVAYVLDGFAKLSAMSGIMVIFLVAYEVFPTELRNRGASLILTALSLGSIIAPFHKDIIIFVDGQLNYSIMLAGITLIISLFLVFAVSETKDMTLTETVDESTNKNKSTKQNQTKI